MEKNEKAIFIKCVCGHKVSAFIVFFHIGKLVPGRHPTQHEVEKVKKSLRCKMCRRKGNVSFVFKQSVVVDKYPFRATAKSPNNLFHRSSCGAMGNVRIGDEMLFKSKGEAESQGHQPCQSCLP